jgi:hypothetical protein
MASRTRLGVVTALTVASFLLGGGAMNALAKDNGHGRGHGNAEHAQAEHGNAGHAQAEHGRAEAAQAEHAQAEQAQVERAQVEDAQAQAAVTDVVDEPDRVTGETRPGLGCGDDNHVHTGPPGNPDKECKAKHGDDSDDGEDDNGDGD